MRQFDRRRAYGLVLVAAAVASCLVSVPAHAASPVVIVTASTTSSSSSFKRVHVYCPAGFEITGVGASVTDGKGKAWVVGASTLDYPYDPDLAEAYAQETPFGYSGAWRLDVQAICRSDPEFDNTLHETQDIGVTTSYTTGVEATCPSGRSLIGVDGGGYISSTGFLMPNYAWTGLVPWVDFSGGLARARRHPSATLSQGGLEVGVRCATGSQTSLGLVRVLASSVVDSASTHRATATCPAGTYLVSSGFAVGRPTSPAGILLDDLKVTATSVTVLGQEWSGDYTANWGVDAYAICAP